MRDFQIISRNKHKTQLFILIFCFLIFSLVFTISYNFSPANAYILAILALVVALAGSFFSYYYSDSLILKMAKAYPVVMEKEPYLFHTIDGVAVAADIPMPKAYIIETEIPNAFATGRDPEHSAIAVTRGLLNLMNKEELEGVIAHEISHIKNYDILYTSIAIVLAGTLVYLADLVRRNIFYGFRAHNKNNKEKGNPILMIVGLITIIFAPILAKLIQMAMSRSREYMADATAALIIGYPLGLASALRKLSGNQNPQQASDDGFANDATAGLFIVNPLNLVSVDSIFSTHPPLEKRIEILENM